MSKLIQICVYVRMYVCMYVCMCLCIYVSIYLCIYVSIDICNKYKIYVHAWVPDVYIHVTYTDIPGSQMQIYS